MTWVAVAAGAASLIGGAMQSRAASRAADAQTQAAMAGIEEQRRQFDEIRALLAPYTSIGNAALGQQRDLLGLTGPDEQRAAIDALRQSPEFTEALRMGENSILANASATGGGCAAATRRGRSRSSAPDSWRRRSTTSTTDWAGSCRLGRTRRQ